MNRKLTTALAVVALLVAGSILSPNRDVLASGSSCAPGRTGDFLYYRLDGWMNPNYNVSGAPGIGGVYSTILDYATDVSSSSDFDYSWVMIANDAEDTASNKNAQNYAQIGIQDRYGYSPRVAEMWTTGGVQATPYYPGYSLTTGNSYQFKVNYNQVSYQTNYYINGTEYDPSTTAYGWTPYQGLISGETHSNSDQMFGDVTTHETFTGSNLYEDIPGYNYGGWENFGTSNGHDVPKPVDIGTPQSFSGGYVQNYQFGYNPVSSTQYDIWDNGCPNSVNNPANNRIDAGSVFDSAGTGLSKYVYSANSYYYLESNAGNGTLEDWEAVDTQCGCAKVLWLTPDWSSSDFALMQNDGNLVLYNAQPLTALWSSGTGGSGSSNYATVGNDGNFVVYTSSGSAVWNAGSNYVADGAGLVYGDVLANGASLTSGNGHYGLVMQSDGNLVLYNLQTSPATWIWQSYTGGDGSSVHLCVQSDGNLVLYSSAGNACSGTVEKSWATGGSGSINHIELTNGGYFQLLTGDDNLIWQS